MPVSRCLPAFAALALLVVVPIAWAQTPSPTGDEASRWAYASDGRNASALLEFLRRYPASEHATKARELLAKRRLQPQGRLVSGGSSCSKLLDERARSLLSGLEKVARFASYDFTVPDGRLAERSEIEFRPRDKPAEQVPIEDVVALDLLAERKGGCVVQRRYSIGSGLPPDCECRPVDSTWVFESELARGVLAGWSQFHGANQACKQEGVDHSAGIDAFLDEWIAGRIQWMRAIRERQANKAFVLPSEAGEADDVEFALPLVSQRTLDLAALDQARAEVAGRPADQAAAYCTRGLPGLIQNARMRTLMSTRRP